jgi:hypothetical protein
MSLPNAERLKTLHKLGNSEALHVDMVCRSFVKTGPWSLGKDRQTYRAAATKDEEPVIPDPQIFAFSDQPGQESDLVLPSVAECAAHLELLEVFFKLRSKIINSPELDAVFGVEQVHPVVYRQVSGYSQRQPYKLKDPDWPAKRREKWGYFLSVAVARFDLWVDKAARTVPEKEGVPLQLPYLPPLGECCLHSDATCTSLIAQADILMVWHAFLLNPKSFERYCQKPDRNLSRLRSVSFPWREIVRQAYRLPSSPC